MRKILLLVLLAAVRAHAQQADILAQTVVLKLPGMESVQVRRNVAYDGTHAMDVYSPKGVGNAPVVIFVNGVGANDFKEWGQYTSWPRLVATRGMAAISYNVEGDARAQTESLLRYVKEHAAELRIDPKRIALWACSGNGRIATAMVAEHPVDEFRAAVFYYPLMETAPKHAELPLLIARAGIDAKLLNDSIDRYAAAALKLEVPLTLINYPEGRHAFELVDDIEESRRIVTQTLDFLAYHLASSAPRKPRQMTPSQVETLIQEKGLAAAVATLTELRKTHPDAFVLGEQSLNGLGYSLIRSRPADAIEMFRYAISVHPQSANLYDSLGDACEAAGDPANAVKAAEHAIELLQGETHARANQIRASAEDKLKRLRK